MWSLPTTAFVLAAAFIGPVRAADCPNSSTVWAAVFPAFGGATRFEDLTVDSDGEVLVAGWFYRTQDLDPTGGVDKRVSVDLSHDILVSKYSPDGAYRWSVTVGGAEEDHAVGVATSANGDVAVTGFFSGTVDFDPTDVVDERTAVGERDDDPNVFLLMLSGDGDYLGVITFGQGGQGAYPGGMAAHTDGGSVITGNFWGTVDFDPGEGEDLRTGVNDIFVSRFTEDGSRLWTRTFGGATADAGHSVEVDSAGDVFIGGEFRGTVDFDPGGGTDTHTALIPGAMFITKLGADGDYRWTRVWQTYPGPGFPLAVGADGSVWTTGAFIGPVDFDPLESGFDVRTSTDEGWDIFVTTLTGDGSYGGTSIFRGFGVESNDSGTAYGLAVASDGSVFVTGSFRDVAFDFDPGDGEDLHTPVGQEDMFVTKLNGDGTYGWTRTMGGVAFGEGGREIAVLDDGSPVLVAALSFTPDLDPGCGVITYEVGSGMSDFAVLAFGCVDPSADVDDSGTVDLRDFAAFQRCFTGEAPTVCQDGCQLLDLDPDDDIDLLDYAEFEVLLHGPGL